MLGPPRRGRAARQIDAIADRGRCQRAAAAAWAQIASSCWRPDRRPDLIEQTDRARVVAFATEHVSRPPSTTALPPERPVGSGRSVQVPMSTNSLHRGDIVFGAVAAADTKETAIDHARIGVVAGDPHGRQRGPAICGRIVDRKVGDRLVSGRRALRHRRAGWPAMLAADRIDEIADGRHHHGAARRRQRGAAFPMVRGQIKSPGQVDRLPLGEWLMKSADHVDIAAHQHGAVMMDRIGQWRTLAPCVLGGVVDLHPIDRPIGAERKAAHHIDAVPNHDRGGLVLRMQHGCELRPSGLGNGWARHRLRLRGGEQRGRGDRQHCSRPARAQHRMQP